LVLDDRFPHFPDHGLGYVYRRGDADVVVWADDKSIEAAVGGIATEADVNDFAALLDSLEHSPLALATWADVHRQVLTNGWESRGALRYNVQSGILLQDALMLAAMADEYWEERGRLLTAAGGRHPSEGSPAWSRWVHVQHRRNATARGARALALAAVEALVNELLAARYPEHYDLWEVQGKKRSFWKKLRGLLRLREVESHELSWFQDLEEHVELRDSMLHHRPVWMRDVRSRDSVTPDVSMTPERLHETLSAVHGAVAGLFALFGAPVPHTHRTDWVEGITS
jgi:hypothetical protein